MATPRRFPQRTERNHHVAAVLYVILDHPHVPSRVGDVLKGVLGHDHVKAFVAEARAIRCDLTELNSSAQLGELLFPDPGRELYRPDVGAKDARCSRLADCDGSASGSTP